MNALAVLVWFGLLLFWAIWVSERVRRKQHDATRQRCLKIVDEELDRVGRTVPVSVRQFLDMSRFNIHQRIDAEKKY